MLTVTLDQKEYPLFELTYWWLESIIDPGTRSSQIRYAETLDAIIDDGAGWLDIGCGRSIVPDWLPDQQSLVRKSRKAVGTDCDVPSLREHQQIAGLVASDLTSLPFREAAFSRISANMVVEHLADPAGVLKEIHRLLGPGGLFIFHTPNRSHYMTALAAHVPEWLKKKFIWLLERRKEDDVFPTHYRLNRLRDIKALAAKSGFRIHRCESLNTSSTGSIFLGPLVILDLMMRRLLRRERFSEFRSHFIVVLEKV